MKRNYKTLAGTFLLILMAAGVTAAEITRSFTKSWPVAQVETLEVINRFGDVKVENSSGSQISVDVKVTVESEGTQARKILESISVNFSGPGSKVTAETKMETEFKSNIKFRIDYTVQIPESKNLIINNKFGNVVVPALTGKGTFNIGYGNFTGGQLRSPGPDGLQLNLQYGKADIESIRDAVIKVSFSKFFLKSMENLSLESRYSTVNIDKLESVRLDSRYDTFNFGEIRSLEGESRYTNYKISALQKRLKLESGYGTIRVDHIPAGFEEIDIRSSYATVSLGIEPGAAYQVYSSCDFCSVDYPGNEFAGNRTSENTRQTVEGKVAGGSSSKVTVVSRFGNIRLIK